MSQDFAKRKKTSSRKSTTRKAAARTSSTAGQTRGKGLRLYLTGVLTGIFISFIGYLSTLPGQERPGAGQRRHCARGRESTQAEL